LVTDQLEERQDRFKRAREVAVLKAMTAFDWHYAMDFGCGVGRNLPLLTKVMKRRWHRYILAVDADSQRLDQAKAETRRLSDGYVNIEYLVTSADQLQQHLGTVLFDLILCCQVFTHMSRAEFTQALHTFDLSLTNDGILVVCVPFHCTDVDGDFFHAIDTALSLEGGAVQREVIPANDFDRLAGKSRATILPVRAFELEPTLPCIEARDLPISVSAPTAFANLPNFSVVSCLVYSIHVYDQARPIVGDIAIKLRKRRP
jgi:SAM-dependent methyltransferase